jgi:metal-responsive CopG/Arc/MetJ family transcriptional regulator
MIEHKMAKKTAISVTVDRDVLRDLDNILRGMQSKEIERGRLRSNRSSLVEEIIRGWIAGQG